MPLATASTIDDARGELAGDPSPLVVVPVYNASDDVLRCFDSLLAHTPTSASILVVDDQGPERTALLRIAAAAATSDHLVVIYQRCENGGFVRACNDAFEIAGSRDVVLVNSDVVVGAEWYERLVDAARSSNTVGTVSTLTNHGTILSVPHRNKPKSQLPPGMTPELAAKAVTAASQQLRPTIPTAVGHCLYIRRAALNTIGGFDLAFAKGYGEEVDFSQRAINHGFKHIVADDVFTYHRGNASFGEAASEIQRRNEALIDARYPWYRHAIQRTMQDRHSPLSQALDCGRRALIGRRIGVDATCLGHGWSGTHTVTYEILIALAQRCGEHDLVAYVTPAISPVLARRIESHGIDLEFVDDLHAHEGTVVDVLYRPYQIVSRFELQFLKRHATRLVVSQLDIIAWANPSYFANEHAWMKYRDLTRLVLATVDGVAFISRHAKTSTDREGLLPPGAISKVVFCGANTTPVSGESPSPPVGMAKLHGRPFLLAMGNAYTHKNRVFALKVLAGLRDRGIDVGIVLAGAIPPDGHSLDDEGALLQDDQDLTDRVVLVGDVDDAEKRWLYMNAVLVLYPTLVEGFGLVPFEAAALGTPTLASRQGSLAEVLPRDIPAIHDFDVDAAVDQAKTLVADRRARQDFCEAVVSHGSRYTWSSTAQLLDELFDEVLAAPPNRVVAAVGENNLPLAVDSTLAWQVSAARRAQLERYVARLQAFRRVRRVLTPEGSARQRLLRSGVNWARRQAHQADAQRD